MPRHFTWDFSRHFTVSMGHESCHMIMLLNQTREKKRSWTKKNVKYGKQLKSSSLVMVDDLRWATVRRLRVCAVHDSEWESKLMLRFACMLSVVIWEFSSKPHLHWHNDTFNLISRNERMAKKVSQSETKWLSKNEEQSASFMASIRWHWNSPAHLNRSTQISNHYLMHLVLMSSDTTFWLLRSLKLLINEVKWRHTTDSSHERNEFMYIRMI